MNALNAPLRSDTLDSLEQFRTEVRQWLLDNCPESQRQPITPEEQYWGGRGGSFASDDARLWFERMRDKGWIVPEWPVEYGGAGLNEIFVFSRVPEPSSMILAALGFVGLLAVGRRRIRRK